LALLENIKTFFEARFLDNRCPISGKPAAVLLNKAKEVQVRYINTYAHTLADAKPNLGHQANNAVAVTVICKASGKAKARKRKANSIRRIGWIVGQRHSNKESIFLPV